MSLARQLTAWALFGIGRAIGWCFDRKWCGGMSGPAYRAYSAFMLWSEAVQGNGPGPWLPVDEATP